jgi:hypothetical protein
LIRFVNSNGTVSGSAIAIPADPGELAAWRSASHVQKAAKKKDSQMPYRHEQQ